MYVDSSPQNALVTINGKRMGYTPNTFTVPSGNLKIILSKIGYISKELTINLDKSFSKKQLFFELYENSRIIKFQDVNGLDFYLDGKFIGKNIEYLELDGMPHIIEITSEKDNSIFFRYIINKDSPKEIILNPRLSTSIEVLSQEKILTYIGDKYAFTPSTILINTIQNTKNIDIYYLNSKKSTILRKNRSQTVFLTNSENVGAVSLFTSSTYALIYIDGKYINKGYVLGHVLNSGTHNITFKFPDGKTYNINININNYEHRVIFFSKANLVPVKIIKTKTFDIYVDDIKYSSSELDLRLEYGVHKIAIYKGQKKIAERFIYLTDEGKYINLDNWY
ncbi:PEGA domain-containing protein [Marinitoga lauensis]|uniref:PEGA domain-containing protein n=1 Tax=Marinitoga lauensis TaxID=2201189 RepID=UPI00140536DB|nr:PEGA domain-containing protein [Marinitoga lauensis]